MAVPATCAFSSAAMVGGCYCANNANSQAAGAMAEDAERTVNPFSRSDLMSKEDNTSSEESEEGEQPGPAQLDDMREPGEGEDERAEEGAELSNSPLLNRPAGASPPRPKKKKSEASSSLCGF